MEQQIQEAKELLMKAGYYVGKLWSVEDVTTIYSCTEEQAQQVLERVLNLPSVMDEIWFAIKFVADDMNLKKLITNKEQIVQIATDLNMTISEDKVKYVLDNIENESNQDPSGNIVLWIEKLLYEYSDL